MENVSEINNKIAKNLTYYRKAAGLTQAELAEKLNVYENSFVYEMMPHKAVTATGTITAGKIIVATHFPFINKHGSYFLKLYQHRSYVSVFENAIQPSASSIFFIAISSRA